MEPDLLPSPPTPPLLPPTRADSQSEMSPSKWLASPPRSPCRKRITIPVLALIAVGLTVIFAFKQYARFVLFWIEHQPNWVVVAVLFALFVAVSFPVVIGYLVLIITSGFLLGPLVGLGTVVLGANFGVAVATQAIRAVNNRFPIHRLIKNETGRAILRVINSERQFRIVLFCRLTPIPFGLQNTIFGVSAVRWKSYHLATLIGLFPAQVINVYLGSRLRSIHDVLNDQHTALTGYGIFMCEVLIGAGLMLWIVQKARAELSDALLADAESADGKLLLEVQT